MGARQRVGLCLERGAEMLAAVLEVLKTSGRMCHWTRAFRPSGCAYMVEDAQVAGLVGHDGAGRAPGPRAQQVLLDADAAAIAAQATR